MPDAAHSTGRGHRRLFGHLALALLVLVVASGIALAPFYSPSHALSDVEALEGGLPWGWLLRAVHGYSAMLLLLVSAAHAAEELWLRTERRLAAGVWWRAVAIVPLLAGALLGGFVLRGDAEAAAAHQVCRGILDSVPVAGEILARLLLGARGDDLGAVLSHHAGTFTILIAFFAVEHGRRLAPDAVSGALAAVLVFALAAFVPLPLGPASAPQGGLLLGPWYLLGLQGMLLDLPAAAAWLSPLAFVVSLGLMRHTDGVARRGAVAFLLAQILLWAGFGAKLLLAGAHA